MKRHNYHIGLLKIHGVKLGD